MIPIIQFDPATMALIFDAQLVGGADNSGKIQEAVDCIIHGQPDSAFAIIDEIEDQKTRDRAIQIVSAMWHEKRHFLDFIISNYGAFRFRQFLEIYINIPSIILTAKERGVIHAPLEIYNDPVRSTVMGIKAPPVELQQIATMLSRRRKMVEYDRRPIGTRFGAIELGGEAQLECLAFMAQLDLVQAYFGANGLHHFFGSLFSWEQFSAKYLSLLNIAGQIGVLPSSEVPGEDGDPRAMQVDVKLLECIVFAALQTDYTPPGEVSVPVETSYPGERFAAICFELVRARPDLCSSRVGALEFQACWDAVNDACRSQFGLGVLEQMNKDHRHFKSQLVESTRDKVPDDIHSMINDYFSLREKMLEQFAEDPELFISSRRFTTELSDKLAPNYVVAASGGVVGEPPEGYDRLMGYKHDEGDVELKPYLKWWWACTPNAESRERRKTVNGEPNFEFSHPKDWYSAMDLYAPIAKLLMNGRKVRTIIGPEILFAQQRLESMFNIKLDIYPSFEYAEETFSADILFYYYGQDTLKCDLTSFPIDRSSARALYPWTLRRWIPLAHHFIEALGGHEVAYFAFIRDWSPWVVSNSEFESLSPLMRHS